MLRSWRPGCSAGSASASRLPVHDPKQRRERPRPVTSATARPSASGCDLHERPEVASGQRDGAPAGEIPVACRGTRTRSAPGNEAKTRGGVQQQRLAVQADGDRLTRADLELDGRPLEHAAETPVLADRPERHELRDRRRPTDARREDSEMAAVEPRSSTGPSARRSWYGLFETITSDAPASPSRAERRSGDRGPPRPARASPAASASTSRAWRLR